MLSKKDAVLAIFTPRASRTMGVRGKLCCLWLGAVLLALLALFFIGAFIALGEPSAINHCREYCMDTAGCGCARIAPSAERKTPAVLI